MKTSLESTLPEFIVVQLDDTDALITCPTVQKRCGNGFIVNYLAWLKSSEKIGRLCPYCFKTSKVPKPPLSVTPSHEVGYEG